MNTEPARVRVKTEALTGVRALAFLNIASGHFVFLMDKALNVDLMGNSQKTSHLSNSSINFNTI
jgi:hypothetical protein